MPTFLILTLGCKLNQLESEAVTDAFTRAGFENIETRNKKLEIEDGKEASENDSVYPSVIVINTCTVTSKADQKARRVIRKALRDYPDVCVIVTGCYAQLNKDDILGLETDGKRRLFVVKKDDVMNLPQYLRDESQDGKPIDLTVLRAGDKNLDVSSYEKIAKNIFNFNPVRFSRHTRSFLKIQDGCDKGCTYCKIRLVRGKSVSLEKEEVLSRLRVLEEIHAEAVLTGVNICQYRDPGSGGREGESNFYLKELLDYLLSGTEKIAIRLSSLSPESVDEKLAKVLAHPRIRPHFHLSIQSGSGKILKKMGRTYDARTVEDAVKLLRGVKEDPFMACDIIAGFPGETEAEFNETFNLCKKLGFAWIHVFPYSKRKGTQACFFADAVSESETTERVRRLAELAKMGRAEYVERMIGKEFDVMIERKKNKKNGGLNYSDGISENYLKALVVCKGKTPDAGTVIKRKLLELNGGYGETEDYDVKVLL